ncbi:alpha/beta fold hydrolase [Rhodococcus sp. 077-4]|uniref:alpha/beta fold hydrolase n=1 Tax=Rhodococcus sp. 077-4 TaxID=2789271 RepID=UPI0039F4BA57
MSVAMLTVGGRRTRVHVSGNREDPPVLLLHGIGRSLEDWAPQFPRLDGYRLIAPDLPGSGFSERSPYPTTLAVLARGVIDTLDELEELRPVHIIGNSLGGAVAQQILALDPDRVVGLVLVNSAGFGKEVTPFLRLLGAPVVGRFLATHQTSVTIATAEKALFVDSSLATSARLEHAAIIAAQPDTGTVVWETVRSLATFRSGISADWQRTLNTRVAAERKPTLVVWGDRDRILPARHMKAAARVLPHARTHMFTNVGHMPQIERPAEFADIVLRFLATYPSSDSSNNVGSGGNSAGWQSA